MFPSGQYSVGWNIHCVGFQDTKQTPPCIIATLWSVAHANRLVVFFLSFFFFCLPSSVSSTTQKCKLTFEGQCQSLRRIFQLSPCRIWALTVAIVTDDPKEIVCSNWFLFTWEHTKLPVQYMSGFASMWVKHPKNKCCFCQSDKTHCDLITTMPFSLH